MANSKTAAVQRYNQGVELYNKGDHNKAITEFRAALDAHRKNPTYQLALASAYNNRGVKRFEKKEYPGAASDFSKAMEIEPKNPQYAQNLKLAKEWAAKDQLDKLCKQGYAAFNTKKYSESIKALTQANKMAPKDQEIIKALAVAYNGRGVSHYEQGRFDLATKDFEGAKKLWPAEPQYGKNIQWTQEAAKRKSKTKKK